MKRWRISVCVMILLTVLGACRRTPPEQAPPAPVAEPHYGQAGKDVVWVPSPPALVEQMLDMAHVTPGDLVVDLGSGDGITVIAAAKRGVKAVGIEYDPALVALSRKRAVDAGVTSLASFHKADLFQTDLSQATVITMFLLPALNMKLRPTLLSLEPGTRIVSNTWGMEDWIPDDKRTIQPCDRWCTALLWIVPAKVAGGWRLDGEPLSIMQAFQRFSGRLGQTPLRETSLLGDQIAFSVGKARYTGRVEGNVMSGTYEADGRSLEWNATRN